MPRSDMNRSNDPDAPICPTHNVPVIPELARDSSGEPFVRYGCALCADDLGLPFGESFVIGTTTQRMRDDAAARGAA